MKPQLLASYKCPLVPFHSFYSHNGLRNCHGYKSSTRPREAWGDYPSKGREWCPGLRSGADCVISVGVHHAGFHWCQQRRGPQGLWDSRGAGRGRYLVLSYRGTLKWLIFLSTKHQSNSIGLKFITVSAWMPWVLAGGVSRAKVVCYILR